MARNGCELFVGGRSINQNLSKFRQASNKLGAVLEFIHVYGQLFQQLWRVVRHVDRC